MGAASPDPRGAATVQPRVGACGEPYLTGAARSAPLRRPIEMDETRELHSATMSSTTPSVTGLRLSSVVNSCAVVAAARAL